MRVFARFIVLLLCCLGMSACQTGRGSDGRLADPATRVFNFDWRLSGDPQAGPMQVFDNGTRIWLHFAPGQRLPAVFGWHDGQETLLTLNVSGQFHVIDALWTELVFRAGRAQARASLRPSQTTDDASHRQHDGAAALSSPAPSDRQSRQNAALGKPGLSGDTSLGVAAPSVMDGRAQSESRSGTSLRSESSARLETLPEAPLKRPMPPERPADSLVAASAAEGETSPATPPSDLDGGKWARIEGEGQAATPRVKGQNQQAVEGPWEEKTQSVFELRLKDKTLRQALIRWARQAKWVFTPEHWALEVDFPIKTAARFEGDFETAVAQLLDAAKLNAHPLQACFYSNRVLRVLSWPQTCKPQRRGEGQS